MTTTDARSLLQVNPVTQTMSKANKLDLKKEKKQQNVMTTAITGASFETKRRQYTHV